MFSKIKEKAEEKKQAKNRKKLQEKSMRRFNDGAFPVIGYDEALNCGIMEDGSLVDFMRIATQDIYSSDGQKVLMEQLLWDRLLKTYPGDLKEISFLFLTDSMAQQEYIDHVARRTKNPVFREILAAEKEKLMEISRDYFDREYVLCFFAKNKAELDDNRLSIKTTLSRTTPPIVSELSADKKKAVFYKLYNKNNNL